MALGSIARKIFGSSNNKSLKKYLARVEKINALEPEIKTLSDDALKARTQIFKDQLAKGATLDDILEPAFATVREAALRVLGQRHYDVQLVGGMVLNESGIAEMRTGEGKTLVATAPVYLNALNSKGVHVITVNDYLARRDSDWMGQIYKFLGLSVGTIIHGLSDEERKAAYAADVTYGTNNEFGFDYLRDNMKFDLDDMSQRGHVFAIVDEVDSILIDEARTPLIISGPSEDKSELYQTLDRFIPDLVEDDYELDEKTRNAIFTEQGIEKLEKILREKNVIKSASLYNAENASVVHHLNAALRAHKLFERDKDYIVQNDEVVIIDEFTGRMMPGRRYGEGQHQAIEAKEKVPIQPENQTMASITFQNYFRLYEKLAGMTGTADTEAAEFADIYNLEVIPIPTNLPVKRIDHEDEIYITQKEKYSAIISAIKECRERNQPILVGTTSIEKSEYLANLLKKEKVKDIKVLNARYHEQEAMIVALAGEPGAITIATNMAGRGTDIQLGGNLDMRLAAEAKGLEGDAFEKKRNEIKADIKSKKQKALEAGGLYVLGTERHESRRIDNQLRGRSGRQGDPGTSKFYLSLEDDLMRIFAPQSMGNMLTKLGLEEGEAISHRMVSAALERAQRKVEARNFDMRKNILKYDDVMNDQRKEIFSQRLELMDENAVSDALKQMREDVAEMVIDKGIPEKSYPEQWDIKALEEHAKQFFNLDVPFQQWANEEGIDDEEILDRLINEVHKAFEANQADYPENVRGVINKQTVLQSIDVLWREHLVTLDHLSKVVGWRGVAQRDPLNEYKSEAFELFSSLLDKISEVSVTQLSHLQVTFKEAKPIEPDLSKFDNQHVDPLTGTNDAARSDSIISSAPKISRAAAKRPIDPKDPSTWGKVRRNELCPCGSGKKYKHCHGALVYQS